MGIEKTVFNGNTEFEKGIEAAKKLPKNKSISFKFSGNCDDRSYPVLITIHALHNYGADFEINDCGFDGGTFRYDPDNNRPPATHDCYSLIGKDSGGCVHPQEIDEIVVYGK